MIIPERDSQLQLQQRGQRGVCERPEVQIQRVLSETPPNGRGPRGENWIGSYYQGCLSNCACTSITLQLTPKWADYYHDTDWGQLLIWKSSVQPTLKFLSHHSNQKAEVKNKSLLVVMYSHDQNVLVREEGAKRKTVSQIIISYLRPPDRVAISKGTQCILCKSPFGIVYKLVTGNCP